MVVAQNRYPNLSIALELDGPVDPLILALYIQSSFLISQADRSVSRNIKGKIR